jgi:hypothetical protein
MEFADLGWEPGTQFVYRLWDAGGECLYVGQHTGVHPAVRITTHEREKPWWPEVARIDYAVVDGDLNDAEVEQIHALLPKYNVANAPFNKPDKAPVDPALALRPRMVRIPDDLWEALGARAASTGRSRSQYVRALLNFPKAAPQ